MTFTIILISLMAGLLVYLIARQVVSFSGNTGSDKLKEAEAPVKVIEKRRPSVFTAFGNIAVRYAPKYAQGIESDLYWSSFIKKAQSTDSSTMTGVDPSEVSMILGRQVLVSILYGILAAVAFKSNLGLIAGFALGWWLSRAQLRSAAEEARNRISQELPEFVQLMAAESASGTGLDEVIKRAAEGKSLVARWIKGVSSLTSGRSLLSPIDEDANGLLHYEAMRSGHLPLALLAVQLGYATRGAQIRFLLQSLAKSYSADFVASASVRAEKLTNTMGATAALFYAIPFMFTILVVVGVPLLKVMFVP